MSAVNPVDAIEYGLELMAYLAAIYIVGFIVVFIGTMFTGAAGLMGGDGGAGGIVLLLVGGIIMQLGDLIILAGNLGIGYKVIADGVQKGVSERAS